MKKLNTLLLFTVISALFIGCTSSKTFKIEFDSSKEVAGKKFALKDINPELPTNWDGYNFVVLEYKISTSQRFQLGFTTDYGYSDLRVMSYVPNQWNKLAIPLKHYTALPDPDGDIAATFNQARYTGWANLGGDRMPMHGVDSIGVRIRKAINNPTIEIRSVTLSVEDPGDEYMGDIPAVDEFGQSNLVEFEGKAKSLAQLEEEWRAEEQEVVSGEAFNYSKYGGYKQKRVKATGYFRTEMVDGKWWFVDPEGYLFLSVGLDCVSIGNVGGIRDYDQRPNMYKELPPQELVDKYGQDKARYSHMQFGVWNLIRRYGEEDFTEKSKELAIKRLTKWGFNTIANWSSEEIYNMNQKAFIIPFRGLGDIIPELMGMCDVYEPNYKASMRKYISGLVQPKNPWLIGYFIGNEPAWLGEEVRLSNLILDGKDRPIKTALKKYLAAKGDTPENRKEFIFDSFRTYLMASNEILKELDPNHLNLGIRFGHLDVLDNRILEICGEAFDVMSFNSYSLAPSATAMDRAMAISKIPMMIGEYHFGSSDRGMAQALWQVDSQKDRGVAYQCYTENAYAHPGLIGTGYFKWSDQDITGRGDGENYNCGFVDVTDRPYKDIVESAMLTATRLYEIHSGSLAPITEDMVTGNPRGYELIPDLWNE